MGGACRSRTSVGFVDRCDTFFKDPALVLRPNEPLLFWSCLMVSSRHLCNHRHIKTLLFEEEDKPWQCKRKDIDQYAQCWMLSQDLRQPVSLVRQPGAYSNWVAEMRPTFSSPSLVTSQQTFETARDDCQEGLSF